MIEPRLIEASAAGKLPRSWATYENKLVGILTLTFGVVMIDRLALNFLAPYVEGDLHLSNGQIGLLASGLSLTWAASGIVVTRICDGIGHQRLILCLSVVLFSLCSFLSGLTGSFGMLLATRLLMGLAEGPVLPLAHSLLARESSPHRRGLNMGTMQMFGSNVLGVFIAPLIIVYVAELWGWRSAFFVAGVPGLICALIVLVVIRDPARPGDRAAAASTQDLLRLVCSRNIVLCMLISGLVVSYSLLSFVFLPLYFVRVSGMSAAAMSILMSLLGVSAVVAGALVSGLSDRFGRKPVIIVFIAIGLVLPLGILLVQPAIPLLAVVLFVGFLTTGVVPIAMATVPAETVPIANMATTVGIVVGAAEILASLTGPFIGGIMADRFGLAATLWLQVGMIAAAVILACFLRETHPRSPRGQASRSS